MNQKDIQNLYRSWRKENQNQKPNRVIVRMHWEDEPEKQLIDTIAIVPQRMIGWTEDMPGDALILYYINSLNNLLELTNPDNGSDFVVDEVCEFYKY